MRKGVSNRNWDELKKTNHELRDGDELEKIVIALSILCKRNKHVKSHTGQNFSRLIGF